MSYYYLKAKIILIFLFLISIVFFCKFYLRPYGFKGTVIGFIPNLFTALSLPLLYYLFKKKGKKINYTNCFFWSASLICLYEFSQLLDIKATFDWIDIIVSVLGSGISSYILFYIFEKKQISDL